MFYSYQLLQMARVIAKAVEVLAEFELELERTVHSAERRLVQLVKVSKKLESVGVAGSSDSRWPSGGPALAFPLFPVNVIPVSATARGPPRFSERGATSTDFSNGRSKQWD